MKRAVKAHLGDFVALIVLFAVAAVVAGYILENQRLRFPVIEEKAFKIKAEFETVQAVMPGQGQTVRVSGIRVGDVGEIELKDGRGIVTMELDREFKDLVHRDAQALLRPKTGLKDMFIELYPGTKGQPLIEEGGTLHVRNTFPDVNPDEFLSSLDQDTRDYLKLLLHGAARGLDKRGNDLRHVLRRFEPTYRDISRVSRSVATRRQELRRLISSLARLNLELGRHDDDLAELVDSSARVFRAFASEKGNISATVRELPTALSQTRRTLAKVETMAEVLGPTADKLRPAVRSLTRANRALTPYARETAPLLRDDIRPFVRELRPVVRELEPAADNLVHAEHGLTDTFKVLNSLFNQLNHNPGGREPPEKDNREEGYLFYLAWLGHQSNSLFSGADAHGPFRPLTTGGSCATLRGTLEQQPQLEFLLGLTGVLTDPRVCGQGPLPTLRDPEERAARRKARARTGSGGAKSEAISREIERSGR